MSNRRGMTLLLVLVMSAFIGISAMLLFSTTNVEMMIAGNTRRINQAKIAATSGISHFVALRLRYDQIKNMAGQQGKFIIIPRTSLGRKTYYEVEVVLLDAPDKTYLIESIGTYQKGNKVISSYPIRAAFTAK